MLEGYNECNDEKGEMDRDCCNENYRARKYIERLHVQDIIDREAVSRVIYEAAYLMSHMISH